ncbi:GntR family transcriptional regulator [Marinisporobacter balticus]|uniref:GntR family transcriptional regulator n=1 Tax=Marinisporobacter balticus TaxID=2018667 RepID=A0A4R2KMC6_9FIRM|nr:GntR family transcriptional regulator [Marinisporobacter balticus]TCO75241.1 GntR family transcriptional regulator [Marinisporobacter balticus]
MFQIDLTSRKPIYEQVMDKFKQLIIKEILSADEKIPSVRELATQLTINPNTIQKSYRELERQGYIYSVRGRGNFVSNKIKKVDEEKLNKLKQQVQNSLSELIYLGIEKEELIELIEKTYAMIKGGSRDD